MSSDLDEDATTLLQCAEAAMRRRDWAEAGRCWAALRERRPDARAGYLRGGFTALQQGDLETAEALLSEAATRFPADPQTALQHAEVATQRRDWAEAARRWAAARARFPNLATAYVRGAFVCLQRGEADAAEALLEAALARFPEDPRIAVQHAEAAMERRDWAEAARRWAAVRARFPDGPAGYVRGAFALWQGGEADAAERVLEGAVARFPDDQRVLAQFAEAAIERRDWAAAARRWAAVRERFPEAADGYVRGAFVCLQRGEADAAEALLEGAVARFPAEPRVAIQFAEAAIERHDWAEAERRWAAVRARFPDAPAGYVRGAFAALQRGDHGAAEALLAEAVARFPADAQAAVQYAEMAVQRRDWAEAGRRWEVARTRFPTLAAAAVGAGTVRLEQGDLKAAEAVLADAAARFPTDAQAAFQWAEVASRRQAWPEAKQRWQAARERFPDLLAGYVGGAAAHLGAGDVEAARNLLREATRVADANEHAPALQRLMLVRGFGEAGFDVDPRFVRTTARRLARTGALAALRQRTDALAHLGEDCPAFDKKALFISGVPRSGTTALVYLLNLHDRISLFNERYSYRYGYHPRMLLDSALFEAGWKKHPFALQWNILLNKTASSLYVGDKRPNFLRSWIISRENFSPDAVRIIHVYRKMEDIAYSYNRRAARAAVGMDSGWSRDQDYHLACADFDANNRVLVDLLQDARWKECVYICKYTDILSNYAASAALFGWLGLKINRRLRRDLRSYLGDARAFLSKRRSMPEEQLSYIREHVDWELVWTILQNCR